MATLNDVVAALDRHVGFPSSRTRTVARRLQEAGMLPSGAPGVSPELDVDDVLYMIVAVGADTTLHAVAPTVTKYLDLSPAGANVDDAPECVPRTAGLALTQWTDTAMFGDGPPIARDQIEIVSTWPEIAFHLPNGVVRRFREKGTLASAWGSVQHRKSVTINGAALVDAIQSLFRKEK